MVDNRTVSTTIYKSISGLSCEIPNEVLPTLTKRVWVDTSYIEPGRRRTIPGPFYVMVYPHASTRLVLSHIPSVPPAEIIISKGLNPTMPIQIRPYGSAAWINTHIYHPTDLVDERGVYIPEGTNIPYPVFGRGTFQKYYPRKFNVRWSQRTKDAWMRDRENWPSLHEYVRSQEIYPFQIRGTSLSKLVKQGHWKEAREAFGIQYLGNIYPAIEYREDQYRWDIPQHLKCYNVLTKAISLGYQPTAELYLYGDIYANFRFPEIDQRVRELKRLKKQKNETYLNIRAKSLIDLLQNFGSLYRNTSGIQIALRDEKDYKFYFTLKSHYLSLCPQNFVVDPEGVPLDIMTSLAWTNQNLLWAHPGLSNIRAGFQVGEGLERKTWDERRQCMVDTTIDRGRPALVSRGEISKDKSYIGFENQEISIGEAQDEYGNIYWLYYAEKIAIYTDRKGVPLPSYDNERIENTLISLGARRIYTGPDGFVWRKKDERQKTLY